MTDSQVHTSIDNNILQVMNELKKQQVKLDSIQCYNIHHESILLDLFTEIDIYDNYSLHHTLTGRLKRHLKPIQRS